ncbi:hypothetical protein M569_02465 [Genlisea aurea]|uniref:BZIP domain-containing protein n=1 Tax=Genlisea aurea TaxID=192259 RepID=S8CZ49_9LAMI|nr:hypothetical protein M569_02465 [Genlisea aurea]
MASKQQPNSPGSDMDDRKRKRMLSNRESARRSRMKKQQRLDELLAEVTQIQDENKNLTSKIEGAAELYINVSSQNNVLRARLSELTDRLQCLNSVLEIASEVSGLAVEIPHIPDSLQEPWQLPYPIQHISAAPVDLFQC